MTDSKGNNDQVSSADPQRPSPEIQARVEAIHHILPEKSTQNNEPDLKTGNAPQILLAERLQYAQGVHQYISEYIQFADAKAGFMFAFSMSEMGFLYSKSVIPGWTQIAAGTWSCSTLLSLLGTGAVLIAAFAAFWVVKPRLAPKKSAGLIFWETVSSLRDANEYIGEVTSLTASGMVAEIVDHTYQLSKVSHYKYKWLNRSIMATGASVCLWVAFFFLAHVRCVVE